MENTQDLSACVAKLQENVLQWGNRLQSEQGGPAAFRLAMNELRAALDEIGRAGFLRLAYACEVASDTLGNDGRLYRFKQMVDKEWMSLWGKVVVPRRLYQEDHGGPSRVPLGERCGMVNRFMVPELERVTAFLGARLVPAEVEDSLGEVLPEPPSRTAIQHVLTTVGQCAEDGAEQLELALQGAAPLDAEGDTLVVSWDGVTVPLREPAPKRGRPAERPMATATDTAPTAWKEAGVGMVATYLTPLDPEVDEHGVFEGFTRILDFYHAAQHLSMAAEHLFGKASAKADRWYRSWRHKLRHTPNAVAGLIRSLSYHRRKLRRRSERYRQATTEMGYFRNNRDKMEYAGYHASGLIISSGPVEAAAKTIVGHRLKRSGMRWTRHGGQQILNLRVQVQSKRWDAFWNWYLQQTTPITTLKRAA